MGLLGVVLEFGLFGAPLLGCLLLIPGNKSGLPQQHHFRLKPILPLWLIPLGSTFLFLFFFLFFFSLPLPLIPNLSIHNLLLLIFIKKYIYINEGWIRIRRSILILTWIWRRRAILVPGRLIIRLSWGRRGRACYPGGRLSTNSNVSFCHQKQYHTKSKIPSQNTLTNHSKPNSPTNKRKKSPSSPKNSK